MDRHCAVISNMPYASLLMKGPTCIWAEYLLLTHFEIYNSYQFVISCFCLEKKYYMILSEYLIHAVRISDEADFDSEVFGGQLLNNYALYWADITQSDSEMANVSIDQYVIRKYFKKKTYMYDQWQKKELILSENQINTSTFQKPNDLCRFCHLFKHRCVQFIWKKYRWQKSGFKYRVYMYLNTTAHINVIEWLFLYFLYFLIFICKQITLIYT